VNSGTFIVLVQKNGYIWNYCPPNHPKFVVWAIQQFAKSPLDLSSRAEILPTVANVFVILTSFHKILRFPNQFCQHDPITFIPCAQKREAVPEDYRERIESKRRLQRLVAPLNPSKGEMSLPRPILSLQLFKRGVFQIY
jgi:hypothetical protein